MKNRDEQTVNLEHEILGEKYCVRCGRNLTAYEQNFCDGLCSECQHDRESIEKD